MKRKIIMDKKEEMKGKQHSAFDQSKIEKAVRKENKRKQSKLLLWK